MLTDVSCAKMFLLKYLYAAAYYSVVLTFICFLLPQCSYM